MASVVDQEETRITEASAISELGVGSTQWFAVQSLEVIVKSFRTFVANFVNSVESINTKTSSTLINFILFADWDTFEVGVEGKSFLTFDWDTSSFQGLESSWACGLTKSIEEQWVSLT